MLANEEVTADGRSERGNFPVFKAKLRQWNMRITAYADRLLDDLDALDWPEAIKLQQRNWIGRSEGARVDFPVDGHDDAQITVFTTRQDTLFGATYMVLAPEHDLVDAIVPAAWPEGTHEVWTGGARDPGRGRRRVPQAGRSRSPTSSGRPRPRTRPVSSPARTRSTRSAASRSRSSSPTTS